MPTVADPRGTEGGVDIMVFFSSPPTDLCLEVKVFGAKVASVSILLEHHMPVLHHDTVNVKGVSFFLAALVNWVGDLCHHFCSCHSWLRAYRHNQQLPCSNQVLLQIVQNNVSSATFPFRLTWFPPISRSDISLLYNDHAVLENHHVSAVYRLLQSNDETNILSNLSKDDWRWDKRIWFFSLHVYMFIIYSCILCNL